MKTYKLIREIVQHILTEAKCPACGDNNAYIGIHNVECPNKSCQFYSQRQANDMHTAAGKRQNVSTDDGKGYPTAKHCEIYVIEYLLKGLGPSVQPHVDVDGTIIAQFTWDEAAKEGFHNESDLLFVKDYAAEAGYEIEVLENDDDPNEVQITAVPTDKYGEPGIHDVSDYEEFKQQFLS